MDVISPKISFTDEQTKSIEIEGILPELTLLSGSVKDQVSGNSNDPAYNSYYFPDPGLIIKDNYWSSDKIIDYNSIEIISFYQFEYYYDYEKPDPFNNVWEFPKPLPKSGKYR